MNNETIHILTFRAHFQIPALSFPSSGNHKMIHKKGGRIRTYGRPALDLLGWVSGLEPPVSSVLEIDVLRYPAPNLVSPTPLIVVPLPIAEIDREVGSQVCSKFLQDVAKPSEGHPSLSKTDYPRMPVVDNPYMDEKPEAWITDLNSSMRSKVNLYGLEEEHTELDREKESPVKLSTLLRYKGLICHVPNHRIALRDYEPENLHLGACLVPNDTVDFAKALGPHLLFLKLRIIGASLYAPSASPSSSCLHFFNPATLFPLYSMGILLPRHCQEPDKKQEREVVQFQRSSPSLVYFTVATLMEKIVGPFSAGSLRLASTDVKVNPLVSSIAVTTISHYHGGFLVRKVVDRNLRLFGALRVVDGSTFTVSPGTNLQATL
ncbi:(R)-mandelonitrile lyase-like [Capsicum baccatum]|uniref:(R)-mandelonitrile lyase-like n=1 Tax=Capsicum baccatum TaxID=33114 RepID=A0A2G2VFL1_CAPBA|nr:(R)-mandelonitrile lyase-like [Capsicum baccatum]